MGMSVIMSEEKNKWIFASKLRTLLKKTPLHKIKIEDIVNDSGTSLHLFYRCFKDKNDLVQFCFKETQDKYMSDLGNGEDWKTTVCAKLTSMTENKSEYMMAFEVADFRGNLQPEIDINVALYKKLLEKYKHKKVDHDIEFLIGCYANAAVSMCAEWIIGGMMETPEHLTELLLEAMPVKLREMLEL